MEAVSDTEEEIPLLGGDVTEGIVRVGNTVRRPQQPSSPLVHALLKHLETVGFAGAPRFLGIDDQGREILTYVEGEVAGRPRPPWIADEDRMISVATLVRAYDDAAESFEPPPGSVPPPRPDPPGCPPGPDDPPDLVAHLDLTPENIVFRDGRAVALIDFDFAKPATRLDEVASMMIWWAPLFDPVDRDPLLRDVDVPRRVGLLADAYGLSGEGRRRLIEVTLLRTRRSWHMMKLRAETDGGGWLRMWNAGVGDEIKRRESWLERNSDLLLGALTES
jgi:hypothetical protein